MIEDSKKIKIVGTLWDYSTSGTSAVASQLLDESLNEKQDVINSRVNQRLTAVESLKEKCLGFFTDDLDLPNVANEGDWAIVPDQNNAWFIWQYDGTSWSKTSSEYTQPDLDVNGLATTSDLNSAIATANNTHATKTELLTAVSSLQLALDNLTSQLQNAGGSADLSDYLTSEQIEQIYATKASLNDYAKLLALSQYMTRTQANNRFLTIADFRRIIEGYAVAAQTYTKLEVDDLISVIPKISIKIVTLRPRFPEEGIIYLIADNAIGREGNTYTAETWTTENGWITLSTGNLLDMSGYVTTQDLNTALAGYKSGPSHYYLTQEEYDDLAEYEQDAIYFILDNVTEEIWKLGGKLPIILS